MIQTYEDEQRMRADSMRVLSRTDVKVAGEKAVLVQLEMKHQGVKMNASLTVFTHQGIAYRVVGLRIFGEAAAFEKEYDGILNTVEFLKERKVLVLSKMGDRRAPADLRTDNKPG